MKNFNSSTQNLSSRTFRELKMTYAPAALKCQHVAEDFPSASQLRQVKREAFYWCVQTAASAKRT